MFSFCSVLFCFVFLGLEWDGKELNAEFREPCRQQGLS